MKQIKRFILIFSSGILLCTCQLDKVSKRTSLLNFSHLERLTQEIILGEDTAAFVAIYSNYPDYCPVEAEGEGLACVDDVARAAILYLRHYKYTNDPISLKRSKKLLTFLLQMQAENGLFYNFIYSDHSINRERKNSQPLADWWTWRACWALAEGQEILRKNYPDLSDRLVFHLEKAFSAIDSLLQYYPQTLTFNGLELPRWLPYNYASDQAAIILLILNSYYSMWTQAEVKNKLHKFAEGILKMHYGDSENFPYSCFLSWENSWHAYGNVQSYALLRTANILREEHYAQEAINEITHFYPYVWGKNLLHSFSIRSQNETITIVNPQFFPQISYGIRPMVWACLEAYRWRGKKKYAEMAGEFACWLLGKNVAKQALYDPASGRCFDGIDDPSKINKNSGAESTIEALLILLEAEQNPISKKIIHDYYSKKFIQESSR